MAKEESEAHIAALTAEFDKQKTLNETLKHELQSARIEADEACTAKVELSHRLEALEIEHAALHSNNADLEDEIEALHDKVSTGYDTLREEMVLQENELSALRAALNDAHTLREAEAKRALGESLRANAEGQRAEEAAALAASRQVEVNAHKLTIKGLRKALAAGKANALERHDGKANALERHDGTTHAINMHLIQ